MKSSPSTCLFFWNKSAIGKCTVRQELVAEKMLIGIGRPRPSGLSHSPNSEHYLLAFYIGKIIKIIFCGMHKKQCDPLYPNVRECSKFGKWLQGKVGHFFGKLVRRLGTR